MNNGVAASGDCLSWATACQTIQEAMDLAAAGDQIFVATTPTPYGNVTMKDGVALLGGFTAGSNTRNLVNKATIRADLDPAVDNSVVTCRNSSDGRTKIEGLIIENGTGTMTQYGFEGGGIFVSNCYITISSNIVRNNRGAIFVIGSMPSTAKVTISNNEFYGNTERPVVWGYQPTYSPAFLYVDVIGNNIHDNEGDGIHFEGSCPFIAYNTVVNNSTLATQPNGGGAGITTYLSECNGGRGYIFTNGVGDNVMTYGIYANNTTDRVVNNTVIRTTWPDPSFGGFGLALGGASEGYNNILAFNDFGLNTNTSYAFTGIQDYNCVYGNTAGNYYLQATAGPHSLSVDPMLAATDFHLRRGSPCIDKGLNSVLPPGSLKDLYGGPRISRSGIVDIGADEY